MVDTISKILSIVLIFLMLIMAPLLISYKMDDAVARREVLFDVTHFIDTVRDTQTITSADLDQFYQVCNSRGITVDVKVRRLVKSVIVDPITQKVALNYTIHEDPAALYSFNKGDGVQVIINEIGVSQARYYMYSVLGADSGEFSLTLAGIVG